jgi:hypothetical protein
MVDPLRERLRASASFVKSKWRGIAALLGLVALVLTVPRSSRFKPAERPVGVSAVAGVSSARPLVGGPGAYLWPPSVGSYPQPEGQHLTLVRFKKMDGPWSAQESKFDLWFDGDVEPQFESRGFESPVSFNVQIPEPRHFSITVTSAPLEAASYIAFSFTSAQAVALVRSDASPKLVADGGR